MLLNTLIYDIYHIGRETGKNMEGWELNCATHTTPIFLEEMKRLAKKYDIEYTNNIFEFMDSDEHKEDFNKYNICILEDRMGAYIEGLLYNKIKQKIKNLEYE